MDATLYYIYDPMCSWCWGFKKTWSELQQRLQGKLTIQYVLGGLAAETDEPMSVEMQQTLQQTWRRVSEHTGAQFNFDFWTNNIPLRSTYPSCKAALMARRFGLERPMYERIQRFYYQEAGNPSDYENLIQLATELGMDEQGVRQMIFSDEINEQLIQEIMFAEQIGAQGFPSLILGVDDEYHFIQHSYTDVEQNYAIIMQYIQA